MRRTDIPLQPSAVCCAVSAALAIMFSTGAHAQQATPATPAAQAAAAKPAAQAKPAEDIATVVVVGVRQAEQSAIERKKNAATAIDSIVADDVGSFPDRNVAEAISRVAGVALERGEFGEGNTINVRGNGADLTRVEIDGMIVASPGGTDLNGSGGGRGSELRELPSDLIASVDVVKGSTADMTEGSLGGGVIIKTRTGLDFKKRTIALRASGQMNTINDKLFPNLNLIYADKFLDGRFGVVANITKSKARNESHNIANVSDARFGFNRDVDLDGSPEKTFQLNPAALDPRQSSIDSPIFYYSGASGFQSYPVSDGGEPFKNLTVKDVVERSYAAKTKQDCFTSLPIAGAEFSRIASATNRARAQDARAGALQSCLAQWNDYVPQQIRYTMRNQFEDRLNADLRFDYKVNSNLTVYAKYNKMNRDIEDSNNSISMGNIGVNTTAANYVQGTGSATSPAVRTLSAAGQAANLTLFPDNYVNRGIASNVYQGLAKGTVVGIVPGSYKVDADHHLTEAVISNANFNNDFYNQYIHTETQTKQMGANYRAGRLKAEVNLGVVEGDFTRYHVRASRFFSYGPVRTFKDEDGVWRYDFSKGVNPFERQMDTNLFTLNAPTGAGQPNRLPAATTLQVQNPRAGETMEKTLKADLSYALGDFGPFFSVLKFGANRRTYEAKNWSASATSGNIVIPEGPGQPLVMIPNVQRTSNISVCDNNAASLAPGGTPCNYGFIPSTTRNSVGSGEYVVGPADYRNLIGQVMANRTSPFFSGSDRGPTEIGAWNYLDAQKAWDTLGVPPVDVGCIKFCKANDGNVYEQPRSSARDKVTATYLSTDFSFDRLPFTGWTLPFGWELSGNFGYRMVRTQSSGTGSLTFTAITTNPGWNPESNNDAVTTRTITRNTTMSREATDYMPVLNLAFWPIADKVVLRYNRAKTIARPTISYVASGNVTCTYDERRQFANDELDTDDEGALLSSSCNNVMGNPGLRPRTNLNQNFSLEWYPNKDANVSLAYFVQKGLIGGPIRQRQEGVRPFADSDIGEVNGRSLADVPFAFDTWVDGPANSRKGIELSARTAFTFLPSVLRHTGVNVNMTKMRSKSLDGQLYELESGDQLSPFRELRHTWNTSLWYDDGSLSMRLSLQVNSEMFYDFQRSNTATRNFPAPGIQRDADDISLPLLPSTPWYKDASRYIDAKIGYKFKNGIEVFAEARNLNNFTPTSSSGPYGRYTDGPMVYDMNYSGRRFLGGVVIRY